MTLKLLDKKLHFTAASNLSIGDSLQSLLQVEHVNTTIEYDEKLGEYLDTHFRVKYSVTGEDSSGDLSGTKGDFCMICLFELNDEWNENRLKEIARDEIPRFMWGLITEHLTYQVKMFGMGADKLKVSSDDFVNQHKKMKRRGKIEFEEEVLK